MRIALLATTIAFALLAGCGSGKQSQANDAQANISTGSRVASNAVGTTLDAPTGQALTKDEGQQAIKNRQDSMKKMGKAMKAAHRELDNSSPNLATIRESAATVSDVSKSVGSAFPKGSGPEAGKTEAKADIWANPQDFTAKLANFQKAAAAFNSAAGGNDVAAIKKGFADLGGTCKACHEKYQAEDKH